MGWALLLLDGYRLPPTPVRKGRFSAMGISSGGMVLLHLGTMQPQCVEAMVLISATSHFPEQARADDASRHVGADAPRRTRSSI